MLPICNRMGGNQFTFQGTSYHTSANSPVSPLYIHGDGWLEEWDLAERSDHAVTLALYHEASNVSPFTYSAQQIIALEAACLHMTLSVTNKGAKAMPFGFGFHPFFPRSNDMTVMFKSSGHWENNVDMLPKTWTPSAGEMDFNSARHLPERRIDNCFMGWDGRAEIIWPAQDMALRIEADDIFKTCQVYAPQNQAFFCFEPMTHLANGLSQKDYPGFKILQPDETLSERVKFHVYDRAYSAAR